MIGLANCQTVTLIFFYAALTLESSSEIWFGTATAQDTADYDIEANFHHMPCGIIFLIFQRISVNNCKMALPKQ